MTRTDRTWTATIAECALDRAQPVLARLAPNPFARINLAQALAAAQILPDRNTPFATDLWPRLEAALGPNATEVRVALQRLPMDDADCPATVFWRVRLRDLHGANAPAVADWADFIQTFRGRAGGTVPDWLSPVAADVQRHRDLTMLVKQQRALSLSPQDRSLYVRFGWNDDGDVPGLTGLLNAAALIRTRRAWAMVAHRFDAAAQTALEAAAAALVAAERDAGLATLDAEARRSGIPAAQLATLYPLRPVPPLSALLTEATDADD